MKASRSKSPSRGPLWLRVLRGGFYAAGTLFLVNAVLIQLFSVTTTEGAPQAAVGSIPAHVFAEKVTVGGGLIPPTDVAGYVNMSEATPVIYVDERVSKTSARLNAAFYAHETAHIQQKELVAKLVGGYPSYENPVLSLAYFAKLANLNATLGELMPIMQEDIPTVAAGLEAAADCYATPRSGTEADPAYYLGFYIEGNLCSPEQIAIADDVAAGKWPRALTPEELTALPPVYVTKEMKGLKALADFSCTLAKNVAAQEDPELIAERTCTALTKAKATLPRR